uniref:Kinesin-like protein Klp98A isoform X2 n=1 Tax=Hirondellea gigas TaxID=1518452 RepID=A0A6A7FU56_9CRUS
MAESNIKVAIRVRPLNEREKALGASCCIQIEGNKTRVFLPQDKSLSKEFTYDHSYWSCNEDDAHYATQEVLYRDIGSKVVSRSVEGYNACVLAYGQTGSGKTHTMTGSAQEPGLIPRICENLFAVMQRGEVDGVTYKVEVSYLEIYNEKIRDLLQTPHVNNKGKKKGIKTIINVKNDPGNRGGNSGSDYLQVRGDSKSGLHIVNLTHTRVNCYKDVEEVLRRGNLRRTTASTNMNAASSRSHAIFTLTFCKASLRHGQPTETRSKINLVDLAGSERVSNSGSTGDRLTEGRYINKSLSTLSQVVRGLSKCSAAFANTYDNTANNYKSASNGVNGFSSPTEDQVIGNKAKISAVAAAVAHHHIPYRDSLLTRLLQDSLGGNSKTFMIATISPASTNYNESLSTLRYASQAKRITNMPTINEDPNVKLIRELREEIHVLQTKMQEEGKIEPESGDVEGESSVQEVLEELNQKQEQEQQLTQQWHERWRLTKEILTEQRTLGLKKSGPGVLLESSGPHLVVLEDAELTSGVVLFDLNYGIETTIGSDQEHTIVLKGEGVLPFHCSLTVAGQSSSQPCTTLTPQEGALCLVNQQQITESYLLCHGSVLVLGLSHMFRYNNPTEAQEQLQHRRQQQQQQLTPLLNSSHQNLSLLSVMSLSTSMVNLSSFSDSYMKNECDSCGSTPILRRKNFNDSMTTTSRLVSSARRPLSAVLPNSVNSEQNITLNTDVWNSSFKGVYSPKFDHKIGTNTDANDISNEEQSADNTNSVRKCEDKNDSGMENSDTMSQIGNEFENQPAINPITVQIDGTQMQQVNNYSCVDLTLESNDTFFSAVSDLSSIRAETVDNIEYQTDSRNVSATNCEKYCDGLIVKCVESLTPLRPSITNLNHLKMNILTPIRMLSPCKSSTPIRVASPIVMSEDYCRLTGPIIMQSRGVQCNISMEDASVSLEQVNVVNEEKVDFYATKNQVFSLPIQENLASIDLRSRTLPNLSEPSTKDTEFTDNSFTNLGKCLHSEVNSNDTAKKSAEVMVHSVATQTFCDTEHDVCMGCKSQSLSLEPNVNIEKEIGQLLISLMLKKNTSDDKENSHPKSSIDSVSQAKELTQKLTGIIEHEIKKRTCSNMCKSCYKRVKLTRVIDEQTDHEEYQTALTEMKPNSEYNSKRNSAPNSLQESSLHFLPNSSFSTTSDNSSIGSNNISCNTSFSSSTLSHYPENNSTKLSPPAPLATGIITTTAAAAIMCSPCSSYHAQISRYIVRNDGNKASPRSVHYLYQIDLRAGRHTWSVLRRYNKFSDLKDQLNATYPSLRTVSFPPRIVYDSTAEHVGRARKKKLQEYLEQVLLLCRTQAWSPLYGKEPCAKRLYAFSSFFRKGSFDETNFYPTRAELIIDSAVSAIL